MFLQTEMKGSPETAAIFEALHANRTSAKERHAEMERKIRQVSDYGPRAKKDNSQLQ